MTTKADSAQPCAYHDRPGEPTLIDLLVLLWRGKLFGLAGAILGLLLASFFLAAAIPGFQAEISVAPPVHGGLDTGVSALLSPEPGGSAAQGSGLGGSEQFMHFEAVLRNPTVSATLMEDPALLERIRDDRAFGFMPRLKAFDSAQGLSQYLQKRIQIEPIGASNIRKIVYRHPDPAVAVALLERITIAADSQLRAGMLADAGRRIDYLNQALEATAHPDHRRALTSLLMEQERLRMVLTMDGLYAVTIVEPVYSRTKPVWPRRTLVLAAMALLGALSGFLAFSMRQTSAAK